MKHKIIALSILVASIHSFNKLQAQNTSGYHIVNTFHIASAGGWDYIALDPGSNKLYQSHSTQVNILDRTTGDSLGVISNTTGVHGIAFDNELNKGYTSNGKINTVTVFDLTTFKILKQISTGQNPDAIMFDNFSKRIITCNGRSKDLSIIDPAADTVVATIPLGGKPETAVSDGAGKIYINIEDKSEIAEVNISKMKVINRWPIAPGESATGLAIDTKTKRLFAGCDNKLLIVMNYANGKIVDKLPIGDGCDGVAFDSKLNYIFASCGEGTLTIINEIAKDKFKVLDVVPTQKGARTITEDEATHKVYLPTSDFESMPLNTDGKTRPKSIAGTFKILVLEK
jgi:YVTN family beta-propeller protein